MTAARRPDHHIGPKRMAVENKVLFQRKTKAVRIKVIDEVIETIHNALGSKMPFVV
jgi:hypothetical protein